MKEVHCHVVYADESYNKLGAIDLTNALDTFRSFPWKEEVLKTEQGITIGFPAICFWIESCAKEREYLNITAIEQDCFSVMIEAFIPSLLFGFIPRRKSAFRDIDGLYIYRVEQILKQF